MCFNAQNEAVFFFIKTAKMLLFIRMMNNFVNKFVFFMRSVGQNTTGLPVDE